MMSLNRVNKSGMKYYIEERSDRLTRIKSLDLNKEIVVNHSIQRISQGWYDWTQEGDSIQIAFPFLNPGEREFLMTGILDDEWDELFTPDDKGDDNR